jgi:ABC-type lipoprotein release transport system permease subunit
MSPFRFTFDSLRHHWRIHLSVVLGVMVATAVLTGALLVGDSVRSSLKHITLDRLGRVDEVLVSDQFFRAELADELAADQAFKQHFAGAVPAIVLQATLESPRGDQTQRAGQVDVLGVGPEFWKLGEGGPRAPPSRDEIVLNTPLAEDLGVQAGDEVLLRVPLPASVPSDTPLGEKTDTLASVRLTVSEVIPASGLGRFGLRPSQQLPANAFVAPETLQRALDLPNRVNAIFVASNTVEPGSTVEASEALAAALRPQAADYGLSIERVTIGPADAPVSEYINITSERMLLPEAVVVAAMKTFESQGAQPALTYLANTLTHGKQKVPYSTVTGVDRSMALGPWPAADGDLADDEMVLNCWAADALQANIGDEIALTYYEPESTHGELVEPEPVTFRVRAIVPLSAKGDPPSQANDPQFTPELKGVTDQASIDDWNLPFELVEEIERRDEDYWEDHRATPKAFVSLARARELWSSRFGNTTSIRVPVSAGQSSAEVFASLKLEPNELGLEFRPLKRLALAASAGTTPFDLLFLGFSFFIIAAAVMLTVLLFRLGVEQRAPEIGALSALGLSRKQISRLLLPEGLIVANVGALLGVALGVGYAWLMLAGLRTWWLAAVSTPFLFLDWTWTSLIVGYFVGLVVALVTIARVLKKLVGVPTRRLLSGQANEESSYSQPPRAIVRIGPWAMLAVAFLLAGLASQLGGEAQAGAFFGSGGLVLAAVLLWLYTLLRDGGRRGGQTAKRFSLSGLAVRNAARNPGRSTLTIGLVAAASFLIIAISAFRLAATDEGTGGFSLFATSSQPIIHDVNSDDGRFELSFSDADSDFLSPAAIHSLRVRGGDDASCLNLYKPRQPRTLGVPQSMRDRGGFAWAASAAENDAQRANPWLLLDKPTASGATPVVFDMNTAMYSLHLFGGVGETYTIDDGDGTQLELEIVGLLKNSIFQGDLLIGEANFLKAFPQTSGYELFLVESTTIAELKEHFAPQIEQLDQQRQMLAEQIKAQPDDEFLQASLADVEEELAILREASSSPAAYARRATAILESGLGDYGFDAQDAQERLAGFLAVQNTYLSTFQSLGALGLLLGTVGLAAVQLRSVLERRGELALLRAAGFRRRRLASLVMLENLLLLVGGLATGVVAALVAVAPHILLGGAGVPVVSLAIMLTVILAVGLLAGLAAVRATVRAPILSALRGD